MMRLIRLLLIIAIAMLSYRPADAQGYCSVGILIDQDYFLERIGLGKLSEDRNYTMGGGFYFSDTRMRNWAVFKPHDWLLQKLRKQTAANNKYYSLVLANGSFTPDDLAAKVPIKNDRPYSSLTYLQANANYVKPNIGRMHSMSISFGVLGTNIAREVQTSIHESTNNGDTRNPRTPRGWGYQVSNNGAPTALITWQESYLITKRHMHTSRFFGGEWKAAWRLDAGWYNMAGGEVSYRLGLLDGRDWIYNNNPLGSSNKANNPSISANAGMPASPKRSEYYVFGTLRGNLVGYNVLLSGQGGADAVNIPVSQVRRGVMDGAVGFCISPVFCRRLNLDLKSKFNFRSPEFESPGRAPRWHYWIGVDLIVTCFR